METVYTDCVWGPVKWIPMNRRLLLLISLSLSVIFNILNHFKHHKMLQVLRSRTVWKTCGCSWLSCVWSHSMCESGGTEWSRDPRLRETGTACSECSFILYITLLHAITPHYTLQNYLSEVIAKVQLYLMQIIFISNIQIDLNSCQ